MSIGGMDHDFICRAKPISQVAEGMPRDAEKIVRRCLRKDPEHRFQAMPDLRVALEELNLNLSRSLTGNLSCPYDCPRTGGTWHTELWARWPHSRCSTSPSEQLDQSHMADGQATCAGLPTENA